MNNRDLLCALDNPIQPSFIPFGDGFAVVITSFRSLGIFSGHIL